MRCEVDGGGGDGQTKRPGQLACRVAMACGVPREAEGQGQVSTGLCWKSPQPRGSPQLLAVPHQLWRTWIFSREAPRLSSDP